MGAAVARSRGGSRRPSRPQVDLLKKKTTTSRRTQQHHRDSSYDDEYEDDDDEEVYYDDEYEDDEDEDEDEVEVEEEEYDDDDAYYEDEDYEDEDSASSSHLKAGDHPTGKDTGRLQELLKKHHLFKELPTNIAYRLAKSLTYTPLRPRTVVMRQGEHDDACYLVESGELDVEVNGVAVFRLERNAVFGEMALVSGEARAATVRCVTATRLWALERSVFLEHAADVVRVKRELWASRIANIPAFSVLQSFEMHFIADSLERVNFGAGDIIIKQGDDGDRMFIVEDGECYALLEAGGRLPEKVASYGPGGFFGERSLLHGDKRGASVYAKTDVILASLGAQRFSALLSGPGGRRVRQRLIDHARAYQKAKSQYVDDKLIIADDMTKSKLTAMLSAPAPAGVHRPVGEQRIDRLTAALRTSVAFADVPDELRRGAVSLMERRLVKSGEDLIRKGDMGTTMYVVEAGELDVIVGSGDEEMAVFRCLPGKCVGEQSLMHHVTRDATVRAGARGAKVWSLSEEIFEAVCRERIQIKRDLSDSFLKQHVLLTISWPNLQRAALADALFHRSFRANTKLWDQGDPPDESAAFFIIEKGRFVVTREPLKIRAIGGSSDADDMHTGKPIPIAHLERGSFFGELALLHPKGSRLAVRTASVECVLDAQCLACNAADFRRIASNPEVRKIVEHAASFYI